MLARISLCSELVLCHILESSGQHTLKSLFFCTLSHVIKILTIKYVLQHYYDDIADITTSWKQKQRCMCRQKIQ